MAEDEKVAVVASRGNSKDAVSRGNSKEAVTPQTATPKTMKSPLSRFKKLVKKQQMVEKIITRCKNPKCQGPLGCVCAVLTCAICADRRREANVGRASYWCPKCMKNTTHHREEARLAESKANVQEAHHARAVSASMRGKGNNAGQGTEDDEGSPMSPGGGKGTDVEVQDEATRQMLIAKFALLDPNNTGTILSTELFSVLRKLSPTIWTEERLDRLLKGMGSPDGSVRYEDFVNWTLAEGPDQFQCTFFHSMNALDWISKRKEQRDKFAAEQAKKEVKAADA